MPSLHVVCNYFLLILLHHIFWWALEWNGKKKFWLPFNYTKHTNALKPRTGHKCQCKQQNFQSFVWQILLSLNIGLLYAWFNMYFFVFFTLSMVLWLRFMILWSLRISSAVTQLTQTKPLKSVIEWWSGRSVPTKICGKFVANHTHLSGNALHHHPGYRSDRAPLRVIKWALGMIQAGQGTDLVLGICGLVGRLKEGHRRREKHRTNPINLYG